MLLPIFPDPASLASLAIAKLGYPPLNAGIAMAPRALESFLLMPIVAPVLSQCDPRKVLGVGLAGAASTLYALSRLNLNAGYWDISLSCSRELGWRCCSSP
jgi:hypothetical protein